jgi:hypothetical protein
MKLEEMLFDRPAAFLAEVEEILGDISIPKWVKVFDEWKDCLKRCIDASMQKANISKTTNLMSTFIHDKRFCRASRHDAPQYFDLPSYLGQSFCL